MAMMARTSIHFRHMAWLALAAALLMALAPAAGRAVMATASKAVPVLMEICTASGMKMIDVAPFLGESEPASPAVPLHLDEACAYCTLATPLPLLLLLLFALLLRPVPSLLARLHLFSPHPLRNLRGLGSQAPPILR